jgi:UDP-glucose 4-epimerase
MSVLVTGAAGNVGYITAMVFAEAGLEVIAHDRVKCEQGLKESLARKSPNSVSWIQGDLNDWPHLLEVVTKYGVDGVIHSAAFSNPVLCHPVPVSATKVNVLSTQYLLELARYGINRPKGT